MGLTGFLSKGSVAPPREQESEDEQWSAGLRPW